MSSDTASRFTPSLPPILTTIMWGNPGVEVSREILNRVQARKAQARRFFKAAHQVHALHRAARSALHQVVDGADDDDAARARVDLEAHIGVVRARQDLRLG